MPALQGTETSHHGLSSAEESADHRARIESITGFEPELTHLDDDAIAKRAGVLRRRALAGESLEVLLPEAFALVRETSRRVLGMRPYDAQIAAGLILHDGKVVEMATGEGKTLAAVAPVFLNALTENGAHVLTFNDYLAHRDASWMGPVYRFLGLSVGLIQEGMTGNERQRAYSADVTYLTAKEVGFDFLRDGLCLQRSRQVQRAPYFALVDEADSILIDEARIPLVIAGAVGEGAAGLGRIAALARKLAPGVDFDRGDQDDTVFLTDRGIDRVEATLGGANLFAADDPALLARIRNALHAEFLLSRNVDYIVRAGNVELIDEFTGRVAERRRWPDGLHSAVEAKEGLRLGADGVVLGSITTQHFLQRYSRLCGMTATARSAADELAEFYKLEVMSVPPHRPCIRQDNPDLIYATRAVRNDVLMTEVARVHASGRPVLVGTVSVAESERLAAELRERGVPCQVLNAKNDEEEARIVAEAGALGAVTISTNMAGRGTDIKLGGHNEAERHRVVELGGLYVLGTSRHESVRIDRQLRGRAGRQGDPGSSRFFVSLEDELPRRYGIARLIPRRLRSIRTTAAITSTVVRREMERAQRIAEGHLFDARRRLYDYSQILNDQGSYVRTWRQEVLENGVGTDLLATRCATRWKEVEQQIGKEALCEVESRLTLMAIDYCFAQYLTDMQIVRDETPLATLDGREPLAEFYRTAIASFEELLERIDDTIVAEFSRLEIGTDGVDWEDVGLRAPSATWTYLVTDSLFANNVMMALSTRASIGLWGVLLLGPVLFAWGLYQHWLKRRKSARGNSR
ncbi:MAG: accessory Sec system translocase SecA2 [Acidobacteriota bacterium]|nr:accessory Sec system translocase SecA2 [Acidobacteriota bacterium]